MLTRLHRAALGVALLASTAGTAAGQTVWTHRPVGASVELEVLRPNFVSEADIFGAATGAGFLTVRAPFASRMALVADLPFTRADFDASGLDAANELGNPYVGVEWERSERFTGELGVRIPVGDALDEDDDVLRELAVMSVGMVGELERAEAFVPATLGVYAMGRWTLPLSDGFTARFRGGPSFLGGDGSAEDVHLTATGQLWYGQPRWNVGGGLAGRWAVTSDDGFSEDTFYQAVLAGDYAFGRLRSGVQLRLPLDQEFRDLAGSTLGFSLGYAIR